jgi:hypothetical protein
VFFTVLSSSGQDYAMALSTGLLVIIAFVAASFVLGLGDVIRGRRRAVADAAPAERNEHEDHDERHCHRAHASAGRSPAGHAYH